MRTPLIPIASAIAAKIRVDELGARIEKSGRLLLEFDEAERTVIEHDHLHRELELGKAQKVAHQHREAPSPDIEMI
jgi:hypothetical protein